MTRHLAAVLAGVLLAALPGFAGAAPQQPAAPHGLAPSATEQTGSPRPQRPVTRPPAPPVKPGSRDPGRPGSIEVSALALWLAPGSLGARDATLTPNQNGTADRYTLFRSSADLGATPGVAATVGYYLTRALSVEGGFSYAPPPVKVTISDDVEQAPDITFDGETLAQYTVDAALVFQLRRLAFARGRGRPFVSAGAGYRREAHADNFIIDTGQVYQVGGGVRYFFKPRARGLVKAFGIRADARVLFGVGGFSFDGRTTRTMSLRGGLLAAF